VLIGCDVGSLMVDRQCDLARGQTAAAANIYFDFEARKKQPGNGDQWTRAATSRYSEEATGHHALTSPICMHWRLAAILQTKLLDLLKKKTSLRSPCAH